MKKIISFILVTLMLLALVGCGQKTSTLEKQQASDNQVKENKKTTQDNLKTGEQAYKIYGAGELGDLSIGIDSGYEVTIPASWEIDKEGSEGRGCLFFKDTNLNNVTYTGIMYSSYDYSKGDSSKKNEYLTNTIEKMDYAQKNQSLYNFFMEKPANDSKLLRYSWSYNSDKGGRSVYVYYSYIFLEYGYITLDFSYEGKTKEETALIREQYQEQLNKIVSSIGVASAKSINVHTDELVTPKKYVELLKK
ncbi:lipoprotein [Clostridium sp. CF012]|uniref:LptM family lipoprotein n=1 Tax=Clostridium sp. CF012 TaxID=2843319 RepID=UPI001C0BAC70|nr:hypothetical protein [Clostridium sp. CF012]MBU3146140.1 hypothetical protein [Clostridium sp. CF012]